MAPAQRLSGMQRQVLSLYRGFMRAARSKDLHERRRIEQIVSMEFRNNAKSVDKKDFTYIEYLLRRGNKQLELLKTSAAVGLSVVEVRWFLFYIFSVNAFDLLQTAAGLGISGFWIWGFSETKWDWYGGFLWQISVRGKIRFCIKDLSVILTAGLFVCL